MSFLVVKAIKLPQGRKCTKMHHFQWKIPGPTFTGEGTPFARPTPDLTRPSRPTAAEFEAPATLPPTNRNFCIRACPFLYSPVADCQETGIDTKPNAHMKYETTFTYHYRVENCNFRTLIFYTICITPSSHGRK